MILYLSPSFFPEGSGNVISSHKRLWKCHSHYTKSGITKVVCIMKQESKLFGNQTCLVNSFKDTLIYNF